MLSPWADARGDVGTLFAVLRSECDFGGNGDGAHNLEAPGDIGERIVQIATTGGGFRRGRFTGLSPHGRAVQIVSESRVLSSELMR